MGLYSHYDRAHTHPVNRALHMIAIPTGFSSLAWFWFHHWIIGVVGSHSRSSSVLLEARGLSQGGNDALGCLLDL